MAHRVRLEPVGIEMEAEEDETILSAAFRQGLMLMHGCKEGQCSACKSYLLDGDLDMERYSTFALADYEREEGYVLLCRSHAYSDLEIELVNYDEEMIRSGTPIRSVTGEVETIEPLTADIRRMVIGLAGADQLSFTPGQYVDITIPGTQRSRSFSMANTPSGQGHLEFIIKMYPHGRFSSLLDGGLSVGDRLALKGPYGMCTLRASSERDLVMIGGGAGMAPLLSLLRSLAESGSRRRVSFYYGARRRSDLFYLEEIAALGERLEGFRFIPALSEAEPGDAWEGETGLVTEVMSRDQRNCEPFDAYLCGPPPMIDAGLGALAALGIEESHIYFDKFTTSADQESLADADP